MLSQSVWSRLSFQLDAVATMLADAPERVITAPGTGSTWSAHGHLAHLGRMHEVLLERLGRILREHAPHVPEYEAEQDPEWPHWAALPTREVLTRLQALRSELLGVVRGLSEAQLSREATHPGLGLLPVSAWLEAFCLHEAHHLHVAWGCLADAKRSDGVRPSGRMG
jgi:hypothetical protein